MSPSNVIKLLKQYWLQIGVDYSISVAVLKHAVGAWPSKKDHLTTQKNHPTGFYRGKFGNDYVFYFMDAGDSLNLPEHSNWRKNLDEVQPA